MKKLLVLTLGGNENPSSNFRMRQYYDLLKKDDWIIIEFNQKNIYYPQYSKNLFIHYCLKAIGLYLIMKFYNKLYINYLIKKVNVVWVNKYVIKEIDLSKTKAKIVQDIDDAIFYNSNKNFNYTLKYADCVFVGNEFLQNEILKIKNVITKIIPTPINLDLYPTKQSFSNKFIIGWIGSPYTNKYLLNIQQPLNEFLNNNDVELHIISDKLADFKNIFIKNTKLIKWNIDTYIKDINKFSIGLMPLSNSNWEKGKCSYKMLQYMACFKPVIVSPVGMNNDILEKYACGFSATNDEEWYDKLSLIFNNKDYLFELGKKGRKAIVDEFSINKNYKVISQTFDNYVS